MRNDSELNFPRNSQQDNNNSESQNVIGLPPVQVVYLVPILPTSLSVPAVPAILPQPSHLLNGAQSYDPEDEIKRINDYCLGKPRFDVSISPEFLPQFLRYISSGQITHYDYHLLLPRERPFPSVLSSYSNEMLYKYANDTSQMPGSEVFIGQFPNDFIQCPSIMKAMLEIISAKTGIPIKILKIKYKVVKDKVNGMTMQQIVELATTEQAAQLIAKWGSRERCSDNRPCVIFTLEGMYYAEPGTASSFLLELYQTYRRQCVARTPSLGVNLEKYQHYYDPNNRPQYRDRQPAPAQFAPVTAGMFSVSAPPPSHTTRPPSTLNVHATPYTPPSINLQK